MGVYACTGYPVIMVVVIVEMIEIMKAQAVIPGAGITDEQICLLVFILNRTEIMK